MKKIFLILSLLSIVACKDETTEKIAHPNIDQKVYFVGNKSQEVFVQEYQENNLENNDPHRFKPSKMATNRSD